MELETCQAIYPELEVRGRWAKLCIPLHLSEPRTVHFHRSTKGLEVSFLPPLTVELVLPTGYPETCPPQVKLQSDILSEPVLKTATEQSISLWNHNEVIFDIIDYLHSQAQQAFGIDLVFDPNLRDGIARYNQAQTAEQFGSRTFLCVICQTKHKGTKCTQLLSCGHVFCTACLKDYFGVCIAQGYVRNVECPQLDCKHRKLAPDQLRLLVGDEQADRFRALYRKAMVEANPDTAVVCPRQKCQAVFERSNKDDLLAVCPDCDFAFCALCLASWHGIYGECRFDPVSEGEVEEYMYAVEAGDRSLAAVIERRWGKPTLARAVAEYKAEQSIRAYVESTRVVSCPRCGVAIEKSVGCNKMVCSQCLTPFCFLCGTKLNPADPYQHYNTPGKGCFEKLLVGM